jgi:putative addiction module component (TIGR02574 family)
MEAKDRLELMEKLWDSLAYAELPITEEEKKLLDWRIADMDANPHAQSSWDEVKARLAKRHL